MKLVTTRGRLDSGGLIERAAPLSFVWNGRRLHGYDGDTLASALLANGERLVGRSFKYHRPRGVVASGAEEPNALVNLAQGGTFEPNQLLWASTGCSGCSASPAVASGGAPARGDPHIWQATLPGGLS